MAKHIDQNQRLPYINCYATEVLSNPTNQPSNGFDMGNDFPSLVQNKPQTSEVVTCTQPPQKLVFNWQSKYVKKQSVGESRYWW